LGDRSGATSVPTVDERLDALDPGESEMPTVFKVGDQI
jgi:hypothetical protein